MPTFRRKVRGREEAVRLLEEPVACAQTLRDICTACRIDLLAALLALNPARPPSVALTSVRYGLWS